MLINLSEEFIKEAKNHFKCKRNEIECSLNDFQEEYNYFYDISDKETQQCYDRTLVSLHSKYDKYNSFVNSLS